MMLTIRAQQTVYYDLKFIFLAIFCKITTLTYDNFYVLALFDPFNLYLGIKYIQETVHLSCFFWDIKECFFSSTHQYPSLLLCTTKPPSVSTRHSNQVKSVILSLQKKPVCMTRWQSLLTVSILDL